MRSLLLFCAALSPLSLLAGETEPVRPLSEMNGGCGSYKIPLTQEFKDWGLGPTPLSTGEGKKGTLLPLNKRLKLMLEPVSTVKYVKAPAKGASKGYGAVMPLRIANTATYKIAAGEKVWIEVAGEDGAPVLAERFEMQTGCDKIRKVVTYKLDGGKDYLLQLAGADKSAVDVMISKQL